MTNSAVDAYAEKIESLAAFHTAEVSHLSRFGYKPMITFREYGRIIETAGRMAQTSERMAAVAHNVIHRVNMYGDRAQACAAIYAAMAEAMSNKFLDVAGLSGPEAGRYSDHALAWQLSHKVVAYGWANVLCAGLTGSVDGHGWALQELATRENVALPRF